ncbi:MAG: hypothetical protein JWL81_2454 [Verrucomicrobiales bacterium]|nr:hypothetical protein [Verrucomicrobiales bacterium]
MSPDAPASPPIPDAGDFPDRLPPMLVKELRQGLRTRLFAQTIIGFHLMMIVLILPLATFSPTESAHGTQQLCWWIFAAVLVLLLPLQALSALTSERRANTLDTLLLTNMGASRIVTGKWLALSARISLTGLSFLPYAFILYTGGGISLSDSALTLLRLILAGNVLAAAFTALSWNTPWLARAAPALGIGWLAMNFHAWPMVARLLGKSNTPGSLESPGALLAELAVAVAAIVIFLEGTAQHLSGGKGPHPARSRLAVLALLPLSLVIPNHPLLLGAAIALLALVSLTAVVGKKNEDPPSGNSSWKTSWLFRSGWPSGILWAVCGWLAAVILTHFLQPGWTSTILRLAGWIFWGRLLMACLPASLQSRSWLLAGTAVLFLALQSLLALAANLLTLPGLAAAALLVPGPRLPFTPDAPAPLLPWCTAAAAAGCLLLSGFSLIRQRPGRMDSPT